MRRKRRRASAIDATADGRSEHDAQTRFRQLIEGLPVVTYITGLTATSQASFVSPQIVSMLGYELSEWNSGTDLFGRLLHPDDRERVLSGIRDAKATGESLETEYRMIARDGRIVWVRDMARMIAAEGGAGAHLQGILLNITPRKQAEVLYQTLVEGLPLITYVGDASNTADTAYYVSPQAEEMLGYPLADWYADHDFFTKLLHPDDRERVLQEKARARQDRVPLVHEYRLIRRNGEVIWIEDGASFIGDDAGPELLVQGYAVDITARKTAEAERASLLERENVRLRELDELKDEFVALVSHELRTPLTSISGYLEMLMSGEYGGLTSEQSQFLSVVERNSRRLLRLVGDLLFVAQADSGMLVVEAGTFDLGALVDDCGQAARPTADARQIELLTSSDVPPVAGDAARVAQMLDNLVSNALKFTPHRGRVSVAATAECGRAVIRVSDTGMGIAPDDQKRLFDRFYRTTGATSRAIQGTGLGLAITKAIVDAHGGLLSVESEEGTGTTFTVELPLAETAGALVAAREAAA